MRYRLYYHVVWATEHRRPLIDASAAQTLVRCLSVIAMAEHARIVDLGVVRTHVHVLVNAHPTTSIPRLIERLKRDSEATVRIQWGRGYAIHTVSPGRLDATRAFLKNQPRHHPEETILNWRTDS